MLIEIDTVMLAGPNIETVGPRTRRTGTWRRAKLHNDQASPAVESRPYRAGYSMRIGGTAIILDTPRARGERHVARSVRRLQARRRSRWLVCSWRSHGRLESDVGMPTQDSGRS